MFKKLYANAYFRVPLKFLITFTACKLIIDYSMYLLRNTKFGIPRTMSIYSGQNPINPPIPKPYPYADSYEHLQNIKAFEKYQRNLFESVYRNFNRQTYLLSDHPCRENPNAIDNFIQYGNIYRIQEYINYTFINKLKSEGIQIPEGINQRIRQLQQYKLDFLRPIAPQL